MHDWMDQAGRGKRDDHLSSTEKKVKKKYPIWKTGEPNTILQKWCLNMHDAGGVWVIEVISDVTLLNYVAWRSNLGLRAFSSTSSPPKGRLPRQNPRMLSLSPMPWSGPQAVCSDSSALWFRLGGLRSFSACAQCSHQSSWGPGPCWSYPLSG